MGPELGRLGDLLRRRDLTVAVAESMTGGLLAAALADLPESSQRFLGGLVSYRTDKKMDLLGVPEDVIARDGVVSGPAARLMADGARRLFHAGLVYTVKDGGLFASLDARDGKVVKYERLSAHGNYYSSPVVGDGKIYLEIEPERSRTVGFGS